ncbi:hypothetical protein Tco_0515333, partial [Tanacetum coccineum]
ETPGPKRTKKKRVTRRSERTPAASHPPKRLRADYGTAGGFATGEQGVPALPTLPFITRSVIASPLDEGGDHTDSMTGPSLRTVGPSARLVVLSDSSHHSGAKSADPKVDSFVRSVTLVTTTATTVMTFVSSVAATTPTTIDAGKDKDVPAPSIFAGSSSSDRTDRTLSLFRRKWSVIRGFELNDGWSCANMIDHFTPPAFFKTVRGMEHEQLRWKSLAEEKDNLLQVKDKEIEDLRSQLLQAKVESMEVHELETSSTDLREKLEMYEGSMKQLEEFHDNLMKPLESRLAEIDVDFTRCCMHFQENFHPHLLNAIVGRSWLLTHGMKLLMAKCLNSTEYMEALGNALLTSILLCRDLRGLDFSLLRELFAKKDASTWDVMDLLRLDDAVAEVLGMTDLQPDVGQLMVPVHHKQDKVVIGSQALSVALETCHHHPIFIEALAILPETSTEPLVTTLVTTALSTMVIRPNPDPFLLNEARDAVL